MEALKGIKPVHQIASDNEIHPVQVSQWKKELQEGMSEIFERKNGRSSEAEEEQRHLELLERKVGQLGDKCSKRPRRGPRPGGTCALRLMWALRSGVRSSRRSNSIARGSDSSPASSF
jgi:transposase